MRPLKRMVLTLLMIFVVLATVAAKPTRYPKFVYYGRVLTVEEHLHLLEVGTPLDCIQLPSVEAYLSDRAVIDFACFHTEAERIAYGKTLQAEWDRIARQYGAPQISSPREQGPQALLSDHWALYANSGYSGWLRDVHNDTSCSGGSTGIWSVWKDGNPNNITLYINSDCTGVQPITLSTSTWSCTWPHPLGCGGTKSGKVP